LRDSSLNFSDEVAESLLGGLFSIITSTVNSLWSLLDTLLLDLGNILLVGNFLGLLLSSQLIDLSGLNLKFFVKNSDNLIFVVFVDEVNEALGQCLWNFVGKFSDGIFNIVCLECFLELLNNCLGTEDSLDFSGVLLWELLSLVFFL